MGTKIKIAMAAGFVGVAALAATAFGQTTSGAAPSPGASARPNAKAQAERPARDGCGRPGKQHPRARRLVHSESKIQMKDGFAVVTLDRGTITSVDPASDTVTIRRADDVTVTASAGDRTRVCNDGKPATVDDLRAGEQAGIVQADYDGNHVVRRITAFSGAAATPTASSGEGLTSDLLDV
jgi:hypothetical protein